MFVLVLQKYLNYAKWYVNVMVFKLLEVDDVFVPSIALWLHCSFVQIFISFYEFLWVTLQHVTQVRGHEPVCRDPVHRC